MADDDGYRDDTNYWIEYTELQRVKHELVESYLQGWFAKLAQSPWFGRVVYFDTHAGRGRHKEGEPGSPIIALRALLDHAHRDALLKDTEFQFVFVERDEENKKRLEQEIATLGEIPKKVVVTVLRDNAFGFLEGLLDEIDEKGTKTAPFFLFIDPYTFKMPGDLLARLMKNQATELFLNFMWRYVDMAIAGEKKSATALSDTLDDLFGSSDWRTRIAGETSDERAEAAVLMLEHLTRARWTTHIRMLGRNRATKYLLVHMTNHREGRRLMKYCLWKVCPGGDFVAWQSENRAQQLLISPEPDLEPLEAWLRDQLKDGPKRWSELHEALLDTMYREPHLNPLMKRLHKEGVLKGEDGRRFTVKDNPLVSLAGEDA